MGLYTVWATGSATQNMYYYKVVSTEVQWDKPTEATPNLVEDIQKDGLVHGVGDWISDHLFGHQEASPKASSAAASPGSPASSAAPMPAPKSASSPSLRPQPAAPPASQPWLEALQ